MLSYPKNLRILDTVVYLPFDLYISRLHVLEMAAFDSLSFERNFEAAVTYALKAVGEKMIWCYKRRSRGMQWQLFIAVRICCYGCQLVLEVFVKVIVL